MYFFEIVREDFYIKGDNVRGIMSGGIMSGVIISGGILSVATATVNNCCSRRLSSLTFCFFYKLI